MNKDNNDISFLTKVLSLLFIFLLFSKQLGLIQISWVLVFMPLFVPFGFYLLAFIIGGILFAFTKDKFKDLPKTKDLEKEIKELENKINGKR